MKTKIISELKKGLGFPHSRGEVAAQEHARIFGQAMAESKVEPRVSDIDIVKSPYCTSSDDLLKSIT